MSCMVRVMTFSLLFIFQFATAQMPLLTADGGVVIQKPDATWSIIPYADNILKVQVNPKNYQTTENITDAVILQPAKTTVKVSSSRGADYLVTWPYMQMQVKGDTVRFGDGEVVLTGMHHSGEYNGFRFLLHDDEKIFGGGERALPLNRRGCRFNLYNNPWYGYGLGADNLNYSVPFFTSSLHYGLFFDNVSKGYVDIAKAAPNVFEYGAVSGQLNFYIISGESYADILSTYHNLTGKQPLPPRWAMGNFLSRFGYVSEPDVKSVMKKMNQYSIPYDAVIFDLFWFGDSIKNTLGNLDWVNKKAWPNPARMINDFKKEGTQTILITEPYVLQSSSNYNKAKHLLAVDSTGKPYTLTNFHFGKGGLIDIFRNDAQQWFWSKYKTQMNKGVAGWWGDLGEPETHPADMYHNLRDLGYKRLFRSDEVHNAYGHYWTKMLFDRYSKEYPNMRLFSLNRSGFAGTQRYSIFPWSGDVSRSWDGLRAQLPVMLGMSMSGVPYIHADAGGFAGKGGDPELYVRWLQFAQFTPIFRPHGAELNKVDTAAGGYPSEPALFDEPYRSLAKHVVEERYALLPYNYTLAYQQTANAKPLVSPLYYYFEKDTTAYAAEDEFMWGESILVAPVLEKGATSRKLYLPAGNWYDWKTFTKHAGNTWRTDSVTMNAIPVYIKEGSFIPYNGRHIKNTQQYNTANLLITYLPSANATEYVLYDDDGKSKNALTSRKYELITFASSGWKDSCTFTVVSNKGSFANKPLSRNFILAIPGIDSLPSSVSINGHKIETGTSGPAYISWDDNMHAAFIHFTFKTSDVVISVQR